VAATLLVTGWFTFAGGVWGFLRYYRDYQDVSYLDIAFYPWRSEQFRTGLARHYLTLGHEAVEKQNYRDGYALLMAGLRRVPEDLGARRKVAVIQVRYGVMHRALDTLVDGLAYNPDLDYLKQTFGWLLEAREDERVISVARTMLPAKADADLKHQFIALQVATANFQRGRYDETERIVGEWGLGNALEGQILLARCDAERGSIPKAIKRLEGEMARFGKRDELYLELVRLLRSQGNFGEARRYALLRQFNNPASAGPRIDVLYAYHETDDRAPEAREIEAYLTDFRADRRALDELAVFAANTHQPALLVRVRGIAESQRFPIDGITLSQTMEAIEREAYRDALNIIEAAKMEKDSYQAQLLNGARAVALYGVADNEGGHRAVINFSENARLRAADALLFARQFRLLGVPQEARSLLERACTVDPFNEAALAELVRLDADVGDRTALADRLPRLLKMRKPSRPVLEEVLLRLQQPEDAELAKQVRDALAREVRNQG
jgi:tetratricopeptide (TPR) repeat protein